LWRQEEKEKTSAFRPSSLGLSKGIPSSGRAEEKAKRRRKEKRLIKEWEKILFRFTRKELCR
jgi:hypothetical protein